MGHFAGNILLSDEKDTTLFFAQDRLFDVATNIFLLLIFPWKTSLLPSLSTLPPDSNFASLNLPRQRQGLMFFLLFSVGQLQFCTKRKVDAEAYVRRKLLPLSAAELL